MSAKLFFIAKNSLLTLGNTLILTELFWQSDPWSAFPISQMQSCTCKKIKKETYPSIIISLVVFICICEVTKNNIHPHRTLLGPSSLIRLILMEYRRVMWAWLRWSIALIHGHRLTAAVAHSLSISWDRICGSDKKRKYPLHRCEKNSSVVTTADLIILHVCLCLCVTGIQATMDLPVWEFFVFLQ